MRLGKERGRNGSENRGRGCVGNPPPARFRCCTAGPCVRSQLTCGWPGADHDRGLRYCRSGWGRVKIISHRRGEEEEVGEVVARKTVPALETRRSALKGLDPSFSSGTAPSPLLSSALSATPSGRLCPSVWACGPLSLFTGALGLYSAPAHLLSRSPVSSSQGAVLAHWPCSPPMIRWVGVGGIS